MNKQIKKLSVVLIIILTNLLICSSIFAQSPLKMSYQAVIRNSSNALVVSHAVGMRISILQGSITGTEVYTETQTPTTNANGLVSIEIGNGPGFSTINWATGPYFIKTETDPSGGTNYTITGTNQLLSVPYSLNAKTAETADYNNLTNLPTLNIANWNTAYSWGNHAAAGYLTSFTETDPIFGASPANGITATNIINWNTAYGWGNHATAGYLTSYTETDPVFSAHLSSHITGADTANWNHKFNIPSFTSGSVLFSNGSTISENNNNFFWDNSNMKLGIGTNTLANSAVLDISSSNRGVLFPRMTTSQRFAITAPADGLMVYDITLKSIFFYTDAYGWRNVSLAGTDVINPGETNIIWYPNKGSFLAGHILVESQDSIGTNAMVTGFDSKAIGNYSQAMGYTCTAIGINSVAIGSNCRTAGLSSVAMGGNCRASGSYSVAMGSNCGASGDYSVAMGGSNFSAAKYSTTLGYNNYIGLDANYSFVFGSSNTSNSPYSIVGGRLCTVGANYGIALGYQCNVAGTYSVSIGRGNTANGMYSTIFGYGNTTSGDYSLATGYTCTAMGYYASVFGYNSSAQCYATMVIGRYNTIAGTTTSWISSEPLFVAGNGISAITRSNALTLYKDGNMTIAGILTQGSDKRLKKNIEALTDVSSQIFKINPVYLSL